MSVSIPYKSVTNADDAYKVVKKNITKEEIEKWNVTADLYYDESNRIITAKGKGFEIVFDFQESEMIADAKMGFLLKPLKNKILGYLEHKVKKIV